MWPLVSVMKWGSFSYLSSQNTVSLVRCLNYLALLGRDQVQFTEGELCSADGATHTAGQETLEVL